MLTATPCVVLLVWILSLIVQGKLEERKREEISRQRAAIYEQLKADPELGLREHWGEMNDQIRGQLIIDSLSDPRVHYSMSQLQRLYDDYPRLRPAILALPACSPEFLLAHFQQACAESSKYPYPMLDAIIRNPNTPLELLETSCTPRSCRREQSGTQNTP